MCKPMQNRGKRMKYYLRGKSLEHLILNPKKRTAKPLPSHPTAALRRRYGPKVRMYGGCYWNPSWGGGTPGGTPYTVKHDRRTN
jgi:hypothetical protein